MSADAPEPWLPTTEALLPLSDSLSQQRAADLRRMGIAQGNVGDIEECPGPMAVHVTARRCPKEAVFLAILGLPGISGNRAAVQVYAFTADHRVSVGRVTTYYMEMRDGRWVLAERGITVIIE